MTLTEKACEIFSSDLYATELTGIVIDSVERDCVVCSLQLKPHHCNAKGAVMGGVLFTLADFTFAIAVHSGLLAEAQNEPIELQWVSSSSNIVFLAQPHGETITARSTCIKQGRTQAVYQITVTDSENRTIALVTTTGTKIKH